MAENSGIHPLLVAECRLFSGLILFFLDKSPPSGYVELDESAQPERK